ncbi:YgaP-like transmembrane domain [Burkholderia stagnalis]
MFYVKNVPGWERVVRIVLGVVVAVLALVSIKGVVGIVVAVAAAGLVVSGLVGFCPACAMVGRRLDKSLESRD